MYEDIRDQGAKLDWDHDSGPAIQQTIDTSSKAVFIPGSTLTKQTIVFPAQIGNHIKGHGCHKIIRPNHKLAGVGSSIVWGGQEGGTIVQFLGNHATWDGVAVWGHLPQQETKAGVGIEFLKPEDSGTGSGRHSFKDLLIQGCDVGIRCGDLPEMPMADVLVFTGLTGIDSCDIGFQVKNRMGMGYKFNRLLPRKVKTVFDFEWGGSLVVDNTTIVSEETETLLKIHNANPNGSAYKFGHVKVDAINENVMLVDMVNPSEAYISFDQIQRSKRSVGDYSDPLMFRIKGQTTLRINGHNGLDAGSIQAHEESNVVILDGCRLNVANPLDVLTPESRATVFITNCYDSSGRAILNRVSTHS